MNTKDFNKLLSGIESTLADKKPVITIYSKSYTFINETTDKIEGLKIDIINRSVNVCLYVGYDKTPTKFGFKYETIRDLYNKQYNLTYNQLDKLIDKISEHIEWYKIT